MSSQHYSLRWNNHQTHVLSAFDVLLQTESLVDCTLICDDTTIEAHKVILSACSPYFQKIFVENPCKHPIVVLKDVKGWEIQCIVDFMYKGETSVPESQLNGLIKAAENLKIRGLTSSDQQLPSGLTLKASNNTSYNNTNNIHNGFHSTRSRCGTYDLKGHVAKPRPPPPHSSQSSPISLTHHNIEMRARSPSATNGPPGSGPRRKQARPRRRSGDSIGGSSMDLNKGDSPVHNKSPNHPLNGTNVDTSGSMDTDHNGPENLSLKRSSSSPAMNLVKTETLLDHDARPTSSSDLDHHKASPTSTSAAHSSDHETIGLFHNPMDKAAQFAALAVAAQGNRIHHSIGEHEARVEALQALNFMVVGGGLPPFTHPGLALPSVSSARVNASSHNGHHPASVAAATAATGQRPTSTAPATPSSTFSARGSKGQHSAPRGGPPRSWTNDDLTKALENVWNKRMTTSQASRVYGIPYNSLLMYVRGKYGKSLKLDVLKQKTPAANDNLNTIGNSRSTPKEKMGLDQNNPFSRQNGRRYDSLHSRPTLSASASLSLPTAFSPYARAVTPSSSATTTSTSESTTRQQTLAAAAAFNSLPNALFHQIPGLQEQIGVLGMLPHDSFHMCELLQNIHREQQNALNNRPINNGCTNEPSTKEPKHVGNQHADQTTHSPEINGDGLLMMQAGNAPGSVTSDIRSLSRSPMASEPSLGSGSMAGEDQPEENAIVEEVQEDIDIDKENTERMDELLFNANQLQEEDKSRPEEQAKENENTKEELLEENEPAAQTESEGDARVASPMDVGLQQGEISAV